MMRKVLISLAAAVSALAVASPASAQYYPQQPYGYGYGYNQPSYGYGYNQNYGRVGIDRWLYQLDDLRRQVDHYARQGRLDGREIRAQHRNFRTVDRALRKYGRNGLNRREAYDMDRRIANLRESIMRSAHDSDNRWNDDD
jgi:hypothetical protein